MLSRLPVGRDTYCWQELLTHSESPPRWLPVTEPGGGLAAPAAACVPNFSGSLLKTAAERAGDRD